MNIQQENILQQKHTLSVEKNHSFKIPLQTKFKWFKKT